MLPSDKVLKVMAKHPTVKIQKLCLLDLPVELLDKIISEPFSTLPKARLLSSTCRVLRNVGARHIFGQRTLAIELELDDLKRTRSEANPVSYLFGVALRARAKFLATTQFLLKRPDLTRSLRRLFITNHWSSTLLQTWVHVERFDIKAMEPTFYTPILQDLGRIICASYNLTTLTFAGIDICVELLCAFSQIGSLHSVTYRQCQFAPETMTVIDQASISPTVLNLELGIDEGLESRNQWITLLLYPQLRTLLVRGSSRSGFSNPVQSLQQQCNLFRTLERVYFCYFNDLHVAEFSTWLREAATVGPGLRLTHFKLHTERGLNDLEVFQLLDALRLAPLEVLALDGLQFGDVELIDLIAEIFPNLLGLTLVLRHNYRQTATKLSAWPHPSWEYAPHIASFNRLCHFGWNFMYPTFDPTPSVMMQFENDFATSETGLWEDDPYFEDDRLMALLFAVHCATLQTFAIVDTSICVACWISRMPNGRLQIDDDLTRSFSDRMVLEQRWNPSYGAWPPIFPEGNPVEWL